MTSSLSGNHAYLRRLYKFQASRKKSQLNNTDAQFHCIQIEWNNIHQRYTAKHRTLTWIFPLLLWQLLQNVHCLSPASHVSEKQFQKLNLGNKTKLAKKRNANTTYIWYSDASEHDYNLKRAAGSLTLLVIVTTCCLCRALCDWLHSVNQQIHDGTSAHKWLRQACWKLLEGKWPKQCQICWTKITTFRPTSHPNQWSNAIKNSTVLNWCLQKSYQSQLLKFFYQESLSSQNSKNRCFWYQPCAHSTALNIFCPVGFLPSSRGHAKETKEMPLLSEFFSGL